MEEEPPPSRRRELLPLHILVEIVRRSGDVATIVRCAATFKLLRRAILNPRFYSRLQVGPDRAFLVGVSYSSKEYCQGTEHLDPSRRIRLDPGLLSELPFQPVSSRDGLLVLRGLELESRRDLCIYNTFTGRITALPHMDIDGGKWNSDGDYSPALIDVGESGRSFEVLAMDMRLRTQIFSSVDGKWGAIREAEAPPCYETWARIKELVFHNSPAFIGRTVHWICYGQRGPGYVMDMFILAVRADDATQVATPIEMPPCCPYIDSTDMKTCTVQIAAIDGKLGVVVAETDVISVSTYSSPEGWTRKAAICKRWISDQVCDEMVVRAVRFEGFGERSGTVLSGWTRSG
ncbi:hypothetical protein QOZ80_3AG0213950 [Eleusine coracana subsp. coracana]|nr:hypothetical protein QOZ80_3AG0213950 [Eleusine coracana subsp. coracana]